MVMTALRPEMPGATRTGGDSQRRSELEKRRTTVDGHWGADSIAPGAGRIGMDARALDFWQQRGPGGAQASAKWDRKWYRTDHGQIFTEQK